MKTQLTKYKTEITNYVDSFGLNQYSWWERMLHTFNFDDVSSRIAEGLERDHIELNSALRLKFVGVQFWKLHPLLSTYFLWFTNYFAD